MIAKLYQIVFKYAYQKKVKSQYPPIWPFCSKKLQTIKCFICNNSFSIIEFVYQFSWFIFKMANMYFELGIRKKQGILTTSSPRYDSAAIKKQIYMNGIASNQPQLRTHQAHYSQDLNLIQINRSRSTKELNNMNLQTHAKHPILTKQKTPYRTVQLFQNKNFTPNSNQYITSDIPYVNLNANFKAAPISPLNLNNHFSLNEKIDNMLKINNQNHLNVNLKNKIGTEDTQNNHQMKNLKKTQSNPKLLNHPYKQYIHDSPIITNYQNFQLKQKKQFQSQAYHQSTYNSAKSNEKGRSDGPLKRCKSGIDNFVLSPFALEKNNQLVEQETLVPITFQSDTQLKATIKNLEREIRLANKQKQKDKGKLLQYSINIDKLKFENDFLRRNSGRSKQNIEVKQVKLKDKQDFNELRKTLRQQVEHKQFLEKQKLTILSQLNQALVSHQSERNKWELQQKVNFHKIQALKFQVNSKKKQQALLIQKISTLNKENENYKNKLQQKQKQNKWMGTKLNQLKQALQYVKKQGNLRINKSQLQKFEAEARSRAISENDYKIKDFEIRFKQKDERIILLTKQNQHKQKQIQKIKQECGNLKLKLSQLCNEQLIQKLKATCKIHEGSLLQKNKVIQALAKNMADITLQSQNNKKDKQSLESAKKELTIILQLQKQKSNRLTQQLNIKMKDISSLYVKIQQKQKQITQISMNLAKQSSKISLKDDQISTLSIQLQKYKNVYSTVSQQRLSKQSQIMKIRLDNNELKRQIQIIKSQKSQLSKSLQFKENIYKNFQLQLDHTKKQLTQYRNKSQFQIRQLQSRQKLIQDKISKIKILQLDLQRVKAKLNEKELQMKQLKSLSQSLETKQRLSSELSNCSVSGSIQSAQSNNQYTKLQMRLCAILGIYLTNTIQKIIAPIQQMIKSKKYLQYNSKCYEEILKVFDFKEGQQPKLLNQMKLYKNNYTKLFQINQRLQFDVKILKQQNNYFMNKNEQILFFNKKLENMVESSNQLVIKSELKYLNSNFHPTGTRKY